MNAEALEALLYAKRTLKKMKDSFTREGLQMLGKLIEESRLAIRNDRGKPLSYRALSAFIEERTGIRVHKDTLNRLERGELPLPSAPTLLALAGARFMKDPSGEYYTVQQLCEIAAESRLHRTVSENTHGTARNHDNLATETSPVAT